MCGINGFSPQWCGCILYLKLALLLHKTVLVTFPLASAVSGINATIDSRDGVDQVLPRQIKFQFFTFHASSAINIQLFCEVRI